MGISRYYVSNFLKLGVCKHFWLLVSEEKKIHHVCHSPSKVKPTIYGMPHLRYLISKTRLPNPVGFLCCYHERNKYNKDGPSETVKNTSNHNDQKSFPLTYPGQKAWARLSICLLDTGIHAHILASPSSKRSTELKSRSRCHYPNYWPH